ncbi:MAG: hypothetical protein QXE31_02445 [Candidatus Woesearchaeota archaeon]
MTKTLTKLKINKLCKRCNSEMTVKGINEIGKTKYYILYCEKCKYSCARSSE